MLDKPNDFLFTINDDNELFGYGIHNNKLIQIHCFDEYTENPIVIKLIDFYCYIDLISLVFKVNKHDYVYINRIDLEDEIVDYLYITRKEYNLLTNNGD